MLFFNSTITIFEPIYPRKWYDVVIQIYSNPAEWRVLYINTFINSKMEFERRVGFINIVEKNTDKTRIGSA